MPRRQKIPLSEKFRFEDVTGEMGIAFRHESPTLDMNGNTRMLFMAGGAAAADFNGDGWMDLVLVNSKPGSSNRLYLNDKGKRFIESSAAWGIARTNEQGASIAPIVFDYNNDGRPDLYLARLGCAMLFENTGKAFKDVSKSSGIADCRNSQSAMPFDLDGDGHLDLYVLRYFKNENYFNLPKDRVYPENSADALDGGINTVYRNRGDSTFEDVTEQVGGADTHWTFDAQLITYANSKERGIYMANDFGQDTYYAIENGKLINKTRELFPRERRNGMNVSLADIDGSGNPAAFVSNIYFPEYQAKDNFLWKFRSGSSPEDVSAELKLNRSGWTWGAGFADFDLDGKQDAYIANGFITGTAPGTYDFQASVAFNLPGVLRRNRDYWPNMRGRSWQGNQVDCVFMNRGSHFEHFSAEAGITRAWDGRAVVMVDYDNNGAVDVLVTTQEGPPHLLRNTTVPEKRWIGFSLAGTKSNRDAGGARVKVTQQGKSWFRWATAGHTGFIASSDPRLHFGVPGDSDVEVEVTWPSGQVEKFGTLATGKYHVLRESR